MHRLPVHKLAFLHRSSSNNECVLQVADPTLDDDTLEDMELQQRQKHAALLGEVDDPGALKTG